MDGGLFSPNTMSAAPHDSAMDIDYIDELLLEGCWLQTTDGSEFLHHSPLFDPFIWSNFEANNGESSLLCQTPLQKDTQEERKMSSFYENLSTSESHGQNPTKSPTDLVGCSDHSRRWWIGPEKNLSPGFSVMGRLIRALSYIKESTRNKDALIQIWVPVNRGGRQYLTTNDQPFSLDLNFPSLASYRKISVNYQFPTDENSEEIVGLPGRVFKGKVPEWTPDVRFFRRDEYARVNDAQQFGVGGTIALPVFEQGSRNCLGVIEVVMTTPKINYRPEIETVCKALEAVDLTTSDILSIQNLKAFNGSYQAALPEIWEVLRSACGTHNLPLAQAWVPCIQQGKVGSRHSDENYIRCVSTVDSACYIANPQMQTFHEACSEYHLLKGEGIVGQAFMTNQPCFSSDIASYPKTEYPLSHHAKMFNLHAAVAIRLRSIYTGTNDFVLEFFLPVNCSDLEDQKELLTSLSLIIQKVCWSLRVITDEELEEEKALPVDGVILTKSSDDQQPQDDSLRTSAGFIGDFSTFDEGSLTIASKRGEKRHAKGEKTITLEVLRQYFAGSLKDAAKSIGVCPTTLKRICRQHGIKRWPSRKIKKVGHSLEKLQRVINSVQGASGSLQIESFYTNFPDLASQKLSSSSPFSTSKPDDHSKPSNVHPKSDTFTPRGAGSISPSSSCSQSSSSSQCCSSGIQPHPYPLNISSSEDPIAKEHSGNSVLKRVRSEAEVHASSDEVLEFLPRSQSHISFTKHPNPEPFPLIPRSDGGNSREGHALRIKVSYGEEKIRFRFQNIWKYENLRKEIARRFGIDHMDGFHMKYLDDDSEWVLLTCDADLEECVDLCGPAQNNTIKLLLSRVPQRQSGSSFGCYSTS